jgi:hypothetical protein
LESKELVNVIREVGLVMTQYRKEIKFRFVNPMQIIETTYRYINSKYTIVLCLILALLNPIVGQKTNMKLDSSKLEIEWLNKVDGKMIATQFKKTEVVLKVPLMIESQIKRFFNYSKDSALNGINPFAKQDIEVKMTITSDGQFVQQVDGFFYKNLKNILDHRYNEFRFRFSIPYTVGNWKANIELIIPNQVVTKDSLFFKVVRSSEEGFVEKGRYSNSYRYSRSLETCFPLILDIQDVSPKFSQLSIFSSMLERTDTLFRALDIPNLLGSISELSDYDHDLDSFNNVNDFVSIELVNYKVMAATLSQLSSKLSLKNLPQFKSIYRNYLRYMVARYGYSTRVFDFVIFSDLEKMISLDVLGEDINQSQELEWLQNLTKYVREDCNVRQMIAIKDQFYNEKECVKELISYPMVDLIKLQFTSNSTLKRIENKNILYDFNPMKLSGKAANIDSLLWMNFYANLGDFSLRKNEISDTLLLSLETALRQLKIQKYNFTNKSFYQDIHKLEVSLKSNKSISGFSQLDESQSLGFGYIKQVVQDKTTRKFRSKFNKKTVIHVKLKKFKSEKKYTVTLYNAEDNLLLYTSNILSNSEGDLLVDVKPFLCSNFSCIYYMISEMK